MNYEEQQEKIRSDAEALTEICMKDPYISVNSSVACTLQNVLSYLYRIDTEAYEKVVQDLSAFYKFRIKYSEVSNEQ